MTEREIFVAAYQRLDPVDRQHFLKEACGPDAELRSRVENLLGLAEGAASFLEAPVADLDATAAHSSAEAPGTQIGPYKLLQQIGEGGMGTVFMAEQTQPVQRRVALKIIKPGMDTKLVIARFEAERQALAVMDHPNIARVFDAGTTENGRPYFVMELVKGVPLTKYCDEHRLTPRQRLELFVPVCQAIQHAHQKGIIHRDVKPSNVLVAPYDGKPVVKVIDFGVAKATGQRLTDKTLFTDFGSVVGTMEYMSPEQAELNNQDIDTRSDIYSLGVVLYELLTGTTPLSRAQLKGAAFTEMLRMIREEEPPKPSTRLSESQDSLPTISAQRQTEPAKLTKQVRGELDWIVMKALEKDRNRRYATANGFAADVQRYLADEPVLACPPSMGYRLRKFARRNRVTVVSASLLAVALLAGIVGTTVGLLQTERRAEGERRAKESAEKRLGQIERGINILGSIFENLDPMAEEAEGRPLRLILADRLDQAAAVLEGETVGDPLVVARLQDRLGRTYLGLGQGARAEALFAKAAATRQTYLGPDDPLTLESRHNLAVALQTAGRRQEATRLLEEVWKARQRVLGPDNLDTLDSLNSLGMAYWSNGRPNEGIPLLERVRDGRTRHLGETHDQSLTTRQKLAGAYLSAGRRAEAIALAEQVWADRVKAHGEAHPKSIVAMGNLAYIYQGGYRMKEALALFQHARDQIVPKLGDYHPLTLVTLRNMGHMLWAYRRAPEAVALLEQVRERELMVHGGQHPSTLTALYELAEAYKAAGDLDRALAVFQQAAAGVESLNYEHSYASDILYSLSVVHENLNQLEQAELVSRTALRVVERRHGAESAEYAEALIRIGSLQLLQKKPAAAESDLRQALAILERHPNVREQFYARSLLGTALADQGRYLDAESLLLEVYRGTKNVAEDHKAEVTRPSRRQVDALERLVQLYDNWKRPDDAAKWRKELAARTASAQEPVKPKHQ